MFNCFDNRRFSTAKIGIAIGIESEPHFHISSSIVSCAASAFSKAGSLRQVPAMSLRSRCRRLSPVMPAPRARGFEGDFVEAFTLGTRSPAKGFIQVIRHIADCVLHTLIVGNAGIQCKHIKLARLRLHSESARSGGEEPASPWRFPA